MGRRPYAEHSETADEAEELNKSLKKLIFHLLSLGVQQGKMKAGGKEGRMWEVAAQKFYGRPPI